MLVGSGSGQSSSSPLPPLSPPLPPFPPLPLSPVGVGAGVHVVAVEYEVALVVG